MSLIPRHALPEVRDALHDTRVVVVLGARQVGKSTLTAQVAADVGVAGTLTFDDQTTRESATRDPTGFVSDLRTPVLIDEIQRVPDVLLAIKRRVDDDPTPGQFLLTGSANILTAPRIADALTGRAEYIALAPLTQSEIHGRPDELVALLFDGRVPSLADQATGRRPYAGLMAAGGYPEARLRTGKRRTRFFESYVETILQRDLRTIANVDDHRAVRRLLGAFAATSGSLVNHNSLARDLGTSLKTVQAHTTLLETLFLVRRLPPYSTNLLNRAVKTPKGYITDSGLLAFLIGADEERVVRDDGVAGLMFETFAVMEILRQLTWHEHPLQPFHYRDKDGREVDLVLERQSGEVVGIEIKAAASVTGSDFAGLRHLRERLGDRFRAGVVLYSGEATVPFGDRLHAVPVAALWS